MQRPLFWFILIALSLAVYSCVTTIKLFTENGKLMGILPLEDGKVVYRLRIETPELPQEEVFRRARRWWVNNYRSAKDVFQLVDKETGEIIGKGYGTVSVTRKGYIPQVYDVYHVISFDVSEDYCTVVVYGLRIEQPGIGKYASITSINLPVESFNIGSVNSVKSTFAVIDEQTKKTLASLQNYIRTTKM